MTKKELLAALADVPDDAMVEVVIKASLRTLDLRAVGLLRKITYHGKGPGRPLPVVLIHGEFVES